MASTVTITRANEPLGVVDPAPVLETITATWTASADGTVAATTIPGGKVYGVLQRLITNPGATAPTASYDVALNDEDGIDVIDGLGANRSATASEQALLTATSRTVSNVLSLAISGNSVTSANGVVKITVLR